MRLTVLGSCPPRFDRRIGPVAIHIETDAGISILVDGGIGYERKSGLDKPVLPRIIPTNHLDYIFLTHIHTDHSGLVPWLMKKYKEARLVTTVPTLILGRVVWSDLGRIAFRQGFPGLVPFDADFYQEICERTIKFNEPGWLTLENNIRVYFNACGHTRGAAYVVIEADGKRVAFSGDTSLNDTPTILGMAEENVPQELEGSDLLFLESTYGNRPIKSRPQVVAQMNAFIIETLRGGGRVLATALAIERTQDVALDQVRAGITPVYIDGALAAHVWEIYQQPESCWSPNDVRLKPEEVSRVTCLLDRDDGFRARMFEDAQPYSVVASPGSLQGGYSAVWVKRILPDPKSLVLLCNYQSEDSPGAKLEKFGRGMIIQLGDEIVKVESQVKRIGVSSHAGADQLVRIADWFKPKEIVCYHGTWNARQSLRVLLEKNNFGSKTALNGDIIEP